MPMPLMTRETFTEATIRSLISLGVRRVYCRHCLNKTYYRVLGRYYITEQSKYVTHMVEKHDTYFLNTLLAMEEFFEHRMPSNRTIQTGLRWLLNPQSVVLRAAASRTHENISTVIRRRASEGKGRLGVINDANSTADGVCIITEAQSYQLCRRDIAVDIRDENRDLKYEREPS